MLVVASLNQRQESFMDYYLKNRLLLFTNATKDGDWLWWADQKNEECGMFYKFPERKKGFGLDRFGNKGWLYE
jgi:hypothetical protein